jgi:hypothetical protein
MCLNPGTIEDVKTVLNKCANGKRDYAGVLFEVGCTARFEKHESGGTAQDNETAAKGVVSHMKTRTEDRWLIPEARLSLHAMWVREGCLSDLHSTDDTVPL